MIHTTNYFNSFIEVAEDCAESTGVEPSIRGDKKSIAKHQYEWISHNPYKYTSDDVIFGVDALRKDIPEDELTHARKDFFSKGQPCFRSSPLTKQYGWGLHSNEDGKIAIYALGSEKYEEFVNDDSLQKVKAMRSKRK